MIDLTKETLLTLDQARHRLPERRRGKRPDLATLYRWTSKGVQGGEGQPPIVLEWIMVGSVRCTSLEALQRFCDALTEREQTHGIAAARARENASGRTLTKTRHDQIEAAKRRLAGSAPRPKRPPAPAKTPAALRVHGPHQLTTGAKRA